LAISAAFGYPGRLNGPKTFGNSMRDNILAEALLRLPRRKKRLLALSVDAVICVWAAWAALYLRLEEWTWLVGNQWLTVVASLALALPIFIRFGFYRTIFRHPGLPAMLAVLRGCMLYGAIYALIFTFISLPNVPRTVGLIQPLLLFLGIGASRAFAHYLLGGNYRKILADEQAPRVLIYGAGTTGRQLSAALAGASGLKVAGFLDDDPSLHGALVQGLPVFDTTDIPALALHHNVTDVLLAIPSATRRRRREILERLAPAGVIVRTLPKMADIASGSVQISDIRPLEIEDLLGRDPVEPDQDLLRERVTGKVVLVTGGGGSIGGELCRQILSYAPTKLLVVDSSEFALYSIQRELEERRPEAGEAIEIVPLVASVQDGERMRAIISTWRPDTIYHAAAYKHVPLVEHNPLEGLKNNVFGTLQVVRAAMDFHVPHMVLISTDKAVRPTNVMGASKRLAEMILQSHADEDSRTCFSMVRFGNVLGSSGSVVPLFWDQIRSGGPITITHTEVTRYFMTTREAAQLVIQASAMATGGEVFVLDMGEPVRIYDLAVSMIELSGLQVRNASNPDGDIEIATVGLRPGEKLYEELLIGEDPIPTAHTRIMQARERFLALHLLLPQLDQLDAAIRGSDVERAIELIKRLVPEFQSENGIVDRIATAAPKIVPPARARAPQRRAAPVAHDRPIGSWQEAVGSAE
jgi:FlaA1/EpsC-like NDP-sugar epimerase